MKVAVAEGFIQAHVELDFDVDPGLTLGPIWQGVGNQQMRLDGGTVSRATRTPEGPASVRMTFQSPRRVAVEAWGPGADAAIAGVPELLGAGDEPAALAPHHGLVRELIHQYPGLRLTRTRAVFEALLPAIVGQKVTGGEARASYRGLLVRHGKPAPGPLGLTLPPEPTVLAREPYWSFHEIGLEQRRANTLRRAAAQATRLEAGGLQSSEETQRRLLSVPGIGPWTAAETARIALGDPDAVSIGDFHLPNLVSWAFAREPRGTDERMLELLRPYEGQRARVVLLLELSGIMPPRFGPRMAPRSIIAM